MDHFNMADWANGLLGKIARGGRPAPLPPQHCQACGCDKETYCKGPHHDGPCEACASPDHE